ncbi:PH domain-containing protein [Labedaea rhizosphaerae]|uniref:PH (Pleckstrin Homology) domain-containing protein n=1 Tax=Labedaea rhizosphaerae TaxID=598644 RepID=A0A4R6SJN9_LABRH|nr:PH domain-containing protein [Labedaea rhizosphaerae]TDQ01159.1 PH (Pleckstrin Homology) domain-containing protein [Labedaea rhizosphaerae]
MTTYQARPRRIRFVAIAGAVFFVVVFTVIALLLKKSSTGVFFKTSDQLAMIGIGVVLAAATLVIMRPSVRADDEGIEVRNLLGWQRYEWELVRSISFPDKAWWARVELPDYEYVPVMAIQAFDGVRAVEAMRELRRLHRAYQQRAAG